MSDIKLLEEIFKIIKERKKKLPEKSYCTKLFKKGRNKIAQKVGEEAVELVIEAIADDKEEAIKETSDLLFHVLVLLADMNISIEDVVNELAKREGISGIDEKESRK